MNALNYRLLPRMRGGGGRGAPVQHTSTHVGSCLSGGMQNDEIMLAVK